MTSADPAARPSSWVVVGLDNGGTANNGTVLTAAGEFLVDTLVEVPSRVVEGPADRGRGMVGALETVLAATGTPRAAVRAVGPGHARSGERRRGDLVPRRHQLLRPRVVGLRHPWRARGPAGAARGLQQRRERGCPLRPPRALRRRLRPHGRRSRRSSGPGSAAASSSAVRSCAARPGWPASSGTCRSRWTGCSSPTSRPRCATAGTPATWRASPRSPAS